MTPALTLLAAALAGGSAVPVVCAFDTACIDRRPCFDSAARVEVTVLPGMTGIAVLDFGDARRRAARITRDGVWTTLRTDADIDHGGRVEVLDIAPDGRAVLVVSDPDGAVEMLSREGTCRAQEGDHEP